MTLDKNSLNGNNPQKLLITSGVTVSPEGSPNSPQHNFDDTEKFLGILDPNGDKFEFQFIPDRDDIKLPLQLRQPLYLTPDEAIDLIKRYNTPAQGIGACVTINETDGRGRKTENIIRVRAIFIDVDKNQLQAIKELKGHLKPNMFVKTSSGKFHAYWLCVGVSLDEFKLIQKEIAATFGSDPAVCDLPRIMRLPGTLHLKEDPQLVGLKVSSDITPYTRTQIIDGLPIKMMPDKAIWTNNLDPKDAERLQKKFSNFEYSQAMDPAEAPPDLEKVKSALMFAAAKGLLSEYAGYRDCALFPLTELAKRHPHLREEIEGLCHEVCALGGGNTVNNQQNFDAALQSSHSNPRTIGSLFYDMEQRGWAYQKKFIVEDFSAVKQPHFSSVPRPKPINFDTPPRHRPFMLGTRILRGEVTVLAAPGGKGKSATAIVMACALAAGRKLMHDPVHGAPMQIALYSTEDGRDELRRRILAAKTHYTLSDDDLKRIHVAGADEGSLVLTSGSEKSTVINEAALKTLSSLIAELKIDLLIIDPLGPTIPVGINDNGAMAQMILALKQLAAKHDCAILILHHFKKGADGSAESVAGASALVNHARVAMMINPMSDSEAVALGVLPSDQWRFFRLIDAKTNFAPPSNGVDWLKLETVVLDNPEPPIFTSGDAVQVVVPASFSAIGNNHLNPNERSQVVANVVATIRKAPTPPYFRALGGAKGKATGLSIIRDAIVHVTKRPPTDAGVIAARLFDELLNEKVLVVDDVKSIDRKKRAAVILGPNAAAESEG